MSQTGGRRRGEGNVGILMVNKSNIDYSSLSGKERRMDGIANFTEINQRFPKLLNVGTTDCTSVEYKSREAFDKKGFTL